MNHPNGDTGDDDVVTDGGQTIGTDSGSVTDSLPIKTGAVTGAIAYIATFAITYVLAQVEWEGDLSGQSVEAYEVVGWIMYGGHSVDITSSMGGSGNYLENYYSAGVDTTFPKLLFYAVPVIVLVVAGRSVAGKAVGAAGDQMEAAKAGATVAIGYVALAVVGAFTIFSVTQSGLGQSVTTEPELGGTILFFAAYAVVSGGIGGYVSAQ